MNLSFLNNIKTDYNESFLRKSISSILVSCEAWFILACDRYEPQLNPLDHHEYGF
jgi:hypothetical protein